MKDEKNNEQGTQTGEQPPVLDAETDGRKKRPTAPASGEGVAFEIPAEIAAYLQKVLPDSKSKIDDILRHFNVGTADESIMMLKSCYAKLKAEKQAYVTGATGQGNKVGRSVGDTEHITCHYINKAMQEIGAKLNRIGVEHVI